MVWTFSQGHTWYLYDIFVIFYILTFFQFEPEIDVTSTSKMNHRL